MILYYFINCAMLIVSYCNPFPLFLNNLLYLIEWWDRWIAADCGVKASEIGGGRVVPFWFKMQNFDVAGWQPPQQRLTVWKPFESFSSDRTLSSMH